MKPESKIRQKLKQAKFRHSKKYISTHMKQKCYNCVYNKPLTLKEGSEVVRVCMYGYPDDWNNVICDEELEDHSKDCAFFKTLTAEELKDEFDTFLKTSPLDLIGSQYPDLAALLWVLDQEGLEEVESDAVELPEIVDLAVSNQTRATKPWWKFW